MDGDRLRPRAARRVEINADARSGGVYDRCVKVDRRRAGRILPDGDQIVPAHGCGGSGDGSIDRDGQVAARAREDGPLCVRDAAGIGEVQHGGGIIGIPAQGDAVAAARVDRGGGGNGKRTPPDIGRVDSVHLAGDRTAGGHGDILAVDGADGGNARRRSAGAIIARLVAQRCLRDLSGCRHGQ